MRAVVFVSTVQNPEEPLRCSDGRSLDVNPDNEIVNDFDLIAVEKAVQLKEAGIFDEVVVFSLAPTKNHLLKVLAMGADKAFWGAAENADLTPETVVQTALQNFSNDANTIWMFGKMGVNFESHITAQLFATKMHIPCLSSCFAIDLVQNKWAVDCEEDGGIAHYHLDAPFVVTSELRLAEPRFPSLPNIIRAKKKPIESVDVVKSSHISVDALMLNDEKKRVCCMMSADEFNDEILRMIRGIA